MTTIPTTSRRAGLAALLLTASVTTAAGAAGLPAIQWAADAGYTAAVVTPPDQGGWAGGAAALVALPFPASQPAPLAGAKLLPLRAGLYVRADDMGQTLDLLHDPTDGTVLGSLPSVHRWAASFGVRVDALASIEDAGLGLRPFATGTAGWYRINDDRLGRPLGDVNAFGWSAGAGVRLPVAGGLAFGPAIRYHRVFNDRVGRWMDVGLDVTWH